MNRALKVRCDSRVHGAHMGEHVIASGSFTTVRETTFEQDLIKTPVYEAMLTRDNPFLSDETKSVLDSRGLIRVGEYVGEGAILASMLRLHTIHGDENPPAKGYARASDDSLECVPQWEGAIVESATYQTRRELGRHQPTNLAGRVSVKLHFELPLSIGDVLLINQVPVTVAGIVECGDADILVGEDIARRIGVSVGESVFMEVAVAEQTGAWATKSRATGPCSLITNQPLGGRSSSAAQSIAISHVHTLSSFGLSANLVELLTVKSDDVGSREQLWKALGGQSDFPQPGAPITFEVFLAELTALGFSASPTSAGDHVELMLTPSTDGQRLSISHGEVTKPETLHYSTYKPIPAGPFCETIFGPEESAERRIRFGHIQLPEPIVPFVFRMPARDDGPSILARLIKRSDQQINLLLNHEMLIDDDGIELPRSAPATAGWTGAKAIKRLLRQIPDSDLPSGLKGKIDARAAFLCNTILVLPPSLRPLILLQNGNFATSDLNDLYSQLIRRANRLRKLKDLNVPQPTLQNEWREMQRAADRLFANTLLSDSETERGANGQTLKDLLNIAIVRATMRLKRVDYSARARAIFSRNTSVNHVAIPCRVAERLGIAQGQPVLVTRDARTAEQSTPILFALAQIHDPPVIAINPKHATDLFGDEDIPECVLHRPVLPNAVIEAQRHVGKVLKTDAPAKRSWLDETEIRSLAIHIVEAAFSGTPLSFDGPTGVLLASPGIVTVSAIPEIPPAQSRYKDVPLPPKPAPLRGPQLRSRMRDLAMSLRRKALTFRWQKLDRPAQPSDGTIHLSPWLPPVFEWPWIHGKPLDFIAQLPLDPAREAGVLPANAFADARPGSLLTFFWDLKSFWERPAPLNQLLYFIPLGPDLVRRSHAAAKKHDDPAVTGYTLVSEVVEEMPSWAELRDIFNFEFGEFDVGEFNQFKIDEQKKLPSVRHDTKFGGWPAWIQEAQASGQLLFQVVSDDEISGLTFGDTGALFATLEKSGISLTAQSH